MAELTITGGTTYGSSVTSVVREVPIFKNFPSQGGVVNDVSVTTSLRIGTSANYTFTIYLFKKFTYNSSYWAERSSDTGYSYSCFYQHPNETEYYLTPTTSASMIGDILASKTFTQTVSTTEYTFTLDLTDFGKSMSNWSGDVYLAIVSESTLINWQNSITSTIVLDYNGGIVRYGIDGSYVECEMYYGVGGKYVQVIPAYGVNGSYVEVNG